MKQIILIFILCFSSICSAATLARIQCGGSGGVDPKGNIWQTDSYFAGGARWDKTNQASMSTQPIPYNTLRYSAYPSFSPFSYSIAVLPPTTTGGKYNVTLFFIEPNKTAVGQRVFSVSINGTTVIQNLDLFAVAPGSLVPYTVSFLVITTTPTIQIVLTPVSGNNAVISGIQVDSIEPPPPVPYDKKGQCEYSLGEIYGTPNGLNISGNMFTGTYTFLGCENMSNGPLFITRARCRSNVDGQIFDLSVPDALGVFHSALVAPLVCGPNGSEGPVLPDSSYQDGQALQFVFKIVDTSPQTAAWVYGSIVREMK